MDAVSRVFCGTRGDSDGNIFDDELREIEAAARRDVAKREKNEKNREKAYKVAMRMLMYEPRSAKKLFEKLTEKGFDESTAKLTVENLKQQGLQSDKAFADAFTRGKWRQYRWSPTRIIYELKTKYGLSEEDINDSIGRVFKDDGDANLEEAGNHKASACFGDGAKRDLVKDCKKRLKLMKGLDKETQRRRIVMWLGRRSFQWDTINDVLQELDLS